MQKKVIGAVVDQEEPSLEGEATTSQGASLQE